MESILTSDSHPIRVDFLPREVVGLPGLLGMTITPGKCHLSQLGLWQRNLDQDLARLRDFYLTDLLVTLNELSELQILQIPDLLQRVNAFGMISRHYPIRDYSIPPSIATLMTLVREILQAVERSQTVVIHCREGLGRSGLVATACLVARGHSADEAFFYVRETRPGSIETLEQEHFVRQVAMLWQEHSIDAPSSG